MLVVGAGIHGAGVAQAAAAAGYRVAVIEQYEGPARGTSSRSSKLIHGGLRYLEQGDFALVRECLAERALLLRLAPKLVRLTPFYLPVYRHTRRARLTVAAGLSLYALLGGFGPSCRFATVPRRSWPDLDGLARDDLLAVFRYYDAQTDDARLTAAVLESAKTLGAEVHFNTTLVAAQITSEEVRVQCQSPAGDADLVCRVLVNAAGPWTEQVLRRVTPSQKPLAATLVAGSHLLLPGRLLAGAYTLEAADRRVFFASPVERGILVGTTEIPYRGNPAAVAPTPAETAYLRENFCRYFPNHPAARAEAITSFAGLRVLPGGKGPANRRSRETRLVADNETAPRMLSIVGGKLTAYRATAERVLSRIAPSLPRAIRRADTRELKLGD